jgi:hypothetical protein
MSPVSVSEAATKGVEMSDPTTAAAQDGDSALPGGSPDAAQIRAAAAVNSAPDAAKADVAAAAVQALPDVARAQVATTAVRNLPDAAKAGVANAAMDALPDPAKAGVVTTAMKTLPDITKTSVATAMMQTLPDAVQADATAAAVRALPEDAQGELIQRFAPDQAMTNDIWRWIVRTFAFVLGGATVALVSAVFVSFWREVDTALAQMLLTIFTTTAGILAGFVSGRASTARTQRG